MTLQKFLGSNEYKVKDEKRNKFSSKEEKQEIKIDQQMELDEMDEINEILKI